MRRISRRTVLKGLGTAVALPFLEAMMPLSTFAADAKKAPKRLAFLYVPNGIHMADWTPKTEGADFEFTPTLEPLKPFKDHLLVLSGLTCDKARPHGDGPGDHARAQAAFLTGCQARKTAGADIKVGVSADQLAAQQAGHLTKFPSLELGTEGGKQTGSCDSGYSCAYQSTIAWRSPSSPLGQEINPRLVFERLFGAGDGKEAGDSQSKRERYKLSVLDFVAEDARRLQNRLGATDQRKLDEYLDGIRELERRLARADEPWDGTNPKMAKPTGMPKDYSDHLRLMGDLLALAFQADLTRIATFVLANDGSNRSYRRLEVPEGHHDLSHHGGNKDKQTKIAKINRFHIEQVAYLLKRLTELKEGDGCVLDNCMIVYGGAIGDGNRHNHDDLPILLAGKGGGSIQSGRHLRFKKETPLTNLFVAMLDRFGTPVKEIGDSTGALEGLS